MAEAPSLTPINPRGVWDRIAIYQRGDLVTHNGSSYVAVTENIGTEPTWFSAVWQLVAEKGEPGLSIRPRGQWNRTTIYEPRDVVSYDGESWLAVHSSIGVIPSEGHYWQILARRGQPGSVGQGPAGADGPAGPLGPPGPAGSSILSIRTEVADYAAAVTDQVILADATAVPLTVTLPAAAPNTGLCLYVKKIDSSTNTVTVAAADLIDSSATQRLTGQHDSLTMVSDGSTWRIL